MSRWVLICKLALAREKQKIGCRCRPTRGLSFHLAYDRMAFNGLLFIWLQWLSKNEITHCSKKQKARCAMRNAQANRPPASPFLCRLLMLRWLADQQELPWLLPGPNQEGLLLVAAGTARQQAVASSAATAQQQQCAVPLASSCQLQLQTCPVASGFRLAVELRAAYPPATRTLRRCSCH
jgi:hypothetical protein